MSKAVAPSDSTAARVVGSAVLCIGAILLVAYPFSRVLWVLPLESTRLYYVSASLIPLGAVLVTWGLPAVSTGRFRSLTVRRAIPAPVLAPLSYAAAAFHPDAAQPDTIGWAPPATAGELAYQVVYDGRYAMLAVPLAFVVAVAVTRRRRSAAVAAVGVFCAYLLVMVAVYVPPVSIHPLFWLPIVVPAAVAVAVGRLGAEPPGTRTPDASTSA